MSNLEKNHNYNPDILLKMMNKFNLQEVEVFCRLNAFKHQLIAEEEGGGISNENIYEQTWWEDAARLINKNMNITLKDIRLSDLNNKEND